MHELSLATSIVEACAARAGDARVCRVTLEMGRLTCVSPHALRFCFELCADGTPLAGAALDIVEVRGRARCRACGDEQTLDDLGGACGCGSYDLHWLAGEELRIKEMELL